jgi:tRNA pseudouridine13 synthase
VGREIVKRNFDRAVQLLLSYTTEYDTPASKEIRQKSSDPSNYGQLTTKLPRGMDIERQVMSAIAGGKDTISALRSIPITIRRLYVQAYQAFIFNKSLSRSIAAGADLLRPERGDLCFEMEGPSTFGRVTKFENYEGSHQIVPAIRMAGSSFQPGKGRFDIVTRTVLEEEGVEPRDFYIKEMQELSQQGGFRQAPLWCMGFRHRNEPSVVVEFALPKGSYATTLLRELVKPEDPIKSGF